MRCATRLVLVASVLLAMCAGPALAELTLPPINYLGSFRMNGSFGSYGYSGLAYHGAGAQETLYHSNWSTIYGNDIPVPLDPGVVGWGGLNTQTQLLTPTNLGGAIAGGLAVHNDATGAPRLYRGGNNNQVAVCNMDLTGSTYLGTGGVSHHRGFSGPAPAGFVTNVGVPAAQDMLDGFAWCGAPWLYTLAPQLGDGTTVPSTQIMQITRIRTTATRPSSGSSRSARATGRTGSW